MVTPHSDDRILEGGFAGLVPELDVSDLAESLRFWCEVIGFRVAYSRPESSFVYLERDGAQILLNTLGGAWYRIGDSEVGLRQCLVQDPDGYIVRLAQPLGMRCLSPAGPAWSR